MRLIVPASSTKDIEMYNQIGVDEIYLGLREDKEDKDWDIINKRAEINANFLDVKDIQNIKSDAKLSFTLNSSFFTERKIEQVKHQIEITKCVIDNYFVSDPSIIQLVKDLAPDKGIVLSVICACMNSGAVKFYQDLGIKRIILPRHLSFPEFQSLTKNSINTEFEVLIQNQFCRNIDGFCSRAHIPKGDIDLMCCDIPFKSKIINISADEKDLKLAYYNINSIIPNYCKTCGICFIKKFHEIGIENFKIVGRNHSLERKKKDALMIKKVFKMIDNNEFNSNAEYEEKCRKLFKETFGYDCQNRCYY